MRAVARIGEAKRKTQEVEISVRVDLDGRGGFEGRSDPSLWTTC
jgi:imidazoleglycerol phosphate dehydratase HisB